MAASYEGSTGRAILESDGGTNWHRVKIALPAAPAGANQALYFIRVYMDTMAGTIYETGMSISNPAYYGLSFDGNHIDNVIQANYANFYGPFMEHTTKTDEFGMNKENVQGEMPFAYCMIGTTSGGLNQNFSDGYDVNQYVASNPITLLTGGDYIIPTVMALNPADGITTTQIFNIKGSIVDDSIYSHIWFNYSSLDLISIDYKNINWGDLRTQFPPAHFNGDIHNEYAHTIHGDINGTNWRPSAGVMAFPTHFIARYPGSNHKLVIDHISVVYSENSY